MPARELPAETLVPILEAPQKYSPLLPAPLDATQQEKLGALREYLPSITCEPSHSYYAKEQAWLTDACLQRYLRATKWDLEEAKKKLHHTLKWRRDFKPDELSPDQIKPEALTGKLYINGFDKYGRPLLYMKPRFENTKPSEQQIYHVVFNLERMIKIMPEGVETIDIIIDFRDSKTSNTPGLAIAKHFLEILGSHYPERLGVSFLAHTPWFFWPLLKMIGPFIDPVTRQKIKFVDLKATTSKSQKEDWVNLLDFIDSSQLEPDFGGKANFKFEIDAYWSALLEKTGNPF